MMRSLFSGVSGLTSHQTKMDVIGNNIANVNTYGFKGSSVSFADLMYQTSGTATAGTETEGGVDPSQIGYGTQVGQITKNMARSSFQQTGKTLDIAIGGDGFFQVEDKAGNKLYTRAGNLTVDKAGNLVDSNGKFVLGTTNADPTSATGLSATAGSKKIVVSVPDVNTAEKTTTIATTTAAAGVSGPIAAATFTMAFKAGNQINPITVKVIASTGAIPVGAVLTTAAGADTITIAVDPTELATIKTVDAMQTKLNSIIDSSTKVAGSTMANFKGGKLSISIDTSAATGGLSTVTGKLNAAEIAAVNAGAVALISAAAGVAVDKMTVTPQTYSNLTSFNVSESGIMVGVHPVLGQLTFGRIDTATFDNVNGLEESGNSYFSQTTASGEAKVNVPGYTGSGGLVSSALEMSNVNLAQEFSDMITAQRGFQANSRIITTSDSMLEELVNLKR